MRDSVRGRRRVDLDGFDLKEAVRMYLRAKGIVPPMGVEIDVTFNCEDGPVELPIKDAACTLAWDSEISK